MLDFDSAYRNHVFTYKRSIKLHHGKGYLGHPRPHNWDENNHRNGSENSTKTKHLMSTTVAVYNLKMIKFIVFWRTQTTATNVLYFYLELNAGVTY